MAGTVNAAFNQFLADSVNLDGTETKTARSSRDWLMEQVHAFPEKVDGFPLLANDFDIFFGSFARRTKIRPLDDIDIMIGLHGQGSTYLDYGSYIEITASESATRLHGLCNDGTRTLNSRRVVNKFVSALGTVPQYEKAEIHRNEEAAILKLKSYDWNFDIVPCFFTKEDSQGKTYYLIPDGTGRWKRTDPRKDRDALNAVNSLQGGNILNPIRIMKFWNRRPTAPAMGSYLLETMLVTYYLYRDANTTSSFVDLELLNLFPYVADAIYKPVYDLKGIQGDLNDLIFEHRLKIALQAKIDHERSVAARKLEVVEDHKAAIAKWGEIFGPQFPKYG